jgi:hypothetical protein
MRMLHEKHRGGNHQNLMKINNSPTDRSDRAGPVGVRACKLFRCYVENKHATTLTCK